MTDSRFVRLWLGIAGLALSAWSPQHVLCADELNRLDGQQLEGTVSKITPAQVTFTAADNREVIDLAQVLSIRFSTNVEPAAEKRPPEEILLQNRSRFYCEATTSDGLRWQAKSSVWGNIELPLQALRAIKLQAADADIETQWQKLLEKLSSDDMLVIRKGNTLDFLPGVVTEYGQTEVLFLYQGSEIPVKREKVFGIIHPTREIKQNDEALLTTVTGDQLWLERIELQGDRLQISHSLFGSWQTDKRAIHAIDFSQGRLSYLSDLEPDQVNYTPYFDLSWDYQRDRNHSAGPLTILGQRYTKGLWIHSKTELRYRLAGEYTTFQAVTGIDDSVAMNGLGHVRLTVRADDAVLFDADVTAFDKPLPLKFDVTGTRFLTILVDFGKGLDIGDHLVLGDAKLVK